MATNLYTFFRLNGVKYFYIKTETHCLCLTCMHDLWTKTEIISQNQNGLKVTFKLSRKYIKMYILSRKVTFCRTVRCKHYTCNCNFVEG